jgi:integrase
MKGNFKIYFKKDGSFELRYHYGYNENGRPNYKSIYGKSRKEVLDKYNKVINDLIKDNDLLIYSKDYLGYFIYMWLNVSKIVNKKSTYSNYSYTIKARIVPWFADKKKKEITLEFINLFTTSLLSEGLARKSVKDILIILQQILKYGGIDIKIPMPKVPKNEIQIFTKTDQMKLEKELLKKSDTTSFGIYLCLYTGLRIGELCALRWKDIDLDNKKLIVKKTLIRIKNLDLKENKKTIVVLDEPKSLSSIRKIPIPNFLVSMMIKLSENITEETFLISGSERFVEPKTYFNRYKKIIKNLDLEFYNFHALRHTFATRCIENGCDPKTLSELLGHSSVNITLERYVHPNYENKVVVMNQLKPLF